jgi:hypothetical protein
MRQHAIGVLHIRGGTAPTAMCDVHGCKPSAGAASARVRRPSTRGRMAFAFPRQTDEIARSDVSGRVNVRRQRVANQEAGCRGAPVRLTVLGVQGQGHAQRKCSCCASDDR